MRKQNLFILTFVVFLAALPCAASHLVFTISEGQQFGIVHLDSGAFTPVGAPLPRPVTEIDNGPNGTLYAVDSANNLIRIDVSTGAANTVGFTGISLLPGQPSYVAVGFAATGSGHLYGMSWDNKLYRFDPATGAGTVVGATGIAEVDVNAALSGAANFVKGMAGLRNDIYFSYHAFNVGESGPTSDIVPPALYRLDPYTGSAARIGDLEPFTWLLGAVNGVLYGEQIQVGLEGPNIAIVRINPHTAKCHVVVSSLPMDRFFSGAVLPLRHHWVREGISN